MVELTRVMCDKIFDMMTDIFKLFKLLCKSCL